MLDDFMVDYGNLRITEPLLLSEHLNLALLVADIFSDSIFFNKVILGLWAATYNKKQSVWNTGECK